MPTTTPTSIFDLIPQALEEFSADKPATPDVSAYNQFDPAIYMSRLERDSESARWILQHQRLPTP